MENSCKVLPDASCPLVQSQDQLPTVGLADAQARFEREPEANSASGASRQFRLPTIGLRRPFAGAAGAFVAGDNALSARPDGRFATVSFCPICFTPTRSLGLLPRTVEFATDRGRRSP